MILQFVKTNILSKKLRNFLTIFSILVSVMLIISVQNLTTQLKSNVIENAGVYDILVGAPGSSIQLVLNTIFYYDAPIENINIEYMYAFEAITKSGAFAVFRFEDGDKAREVLKTNGIDHISEEDFK